MLTRKMQLYVVSRPSAERRPKYAHNGYFFASNAADVLQDADDNGSEEHKYKADCEKLQLPNHRNTSSFLQPKFTPTRRGCQKDSLLRCTLRQCRPKVIPQ